MVDITIVDGDDWMGIYLGENLIYQGHSISTSSLLDLLNIEHQSRDVDIEWLHDRCELPEQITDVKWEEEDEGSEST